MQSKLSIIILSYNTKNLLAQCLQSVFGAIKSYENTEVIVVDNASADDSTLMVARDFPKVHLIKNKENVGFAKGNNVGVNKATGEIILFLNSDTKIFPESLKETVDFMNSDKKIGTMTAMTLLSSGKMDPDCHRGFPTPWASISYFLGLENFFPKSKIFGQYHKFYLNLKENHEIDAGAGAYMAVKKEVINKVGSWDENYFFYGEDLDFFYRIKKAGFKVMFFAKPLLTHYKGASSGLRKETQKIASNSKENRIKVARASIEAMVIFYRKFFKDQYPGWLTFLVLLAIKIKGCFRILKHKLS